MSRWATTLDAALAILRERGVIDGSFTECVPLAGGTESEVATLGRGAGPELVVKLNRPGAVRAAAQFMITYRDSPLVTPLRYVDPESRFLVYAYVPGVLTRACEVPLDKTQTLLALTHHLLSRYVPLSQSDPLPHAVPLSGSLPLTGSVAAGDEMAGWLDEWYEPEGERPCGRTWQAFLATEVSYRHALVRPHLPSGAGALVDDLVAAPRRRGEGPLSLLHGDCGAHNLLFREGRLVAALDPRPALGEPIFDLAFAFVSWPDHLTLDTILPAAELLERAGRWRPAASARRCVLSEEVVIALYSRIGTCLVHHPSDLPAYLQSWGYWMALLRGE